MPKILRTIASKISSFFGKGKPKGPKAPPPPKKPTTIIPPTPRSQRLLDDVIAQWEATQVGGTLPGHRGVAIGPKAQGPTGTIGEVSRADEQRELGKGYIQDFVYDAQPMFVYSSNISLLQYFIEEEKMMVEFHNGSAYLYSNVSEREAIEFMMAASKGQILWTLFRVRGSRTAHKKPYRRIK